MMRRAAQVMCRAAMARPAAAPMESLHRNAAAPVSVTPRLNPQHVPALVATAGVCWSEVEKSEGR